MTTSQKLTCNFCLLKFFFRDSSDQGPIWDQSLTYLQVEGAGYGVAADVHKEVTGHLVLEVQQHSEHEVRVPAVYGLLQGCLVLPHL